MRVLVTGADEVWGQLTAEAVLAAPTLRDSTGKHREVESVLLAVHDAPWDPAIADDPRVEVVQADIADHEQILSVVSAHATDSILHFETVTRDRGAGDDDFDAMLRVNLGGSLNLLDACRRRSLDGRPPKLVFCSSLSVFADGTSETISDVTRRLPTSSYGTTKAAVELLIMDFSQRGYVDGRSSVLPMCVSWRPDQRGQDFLHMAFQTPFDGKPIPLRLRRDTPIWLNGYTTCIANLLELHDVDADRLDRSRALLQPGVRTTVGEMLSAFAEVAAHHRIQLGPVIDDLEPAVQHHFDGYPDSVDASKALALGLSSDDLEGIVERYLTAYTLLPATDDST